MVPNICQDTDFPWGRHNMKKKKKVWDSRQMKSLNGRLYLAVTSN